MRPDTGQTAWSKNTEKWFHSLGLLLRRFDFRPLSRSESSDVMMKGLRSIDARPCCLRWLGQPPL
jgi:hypothetical protein